MTASMRISEPLRLSTSFVSPSRSRLDAHAVPLAVTCAAPRRPLMWSQPARPMMTMRVTPADGAATLRFSLNEQSPKRSAEAVVAARRRTSEARVRMDEGTCFLVWGFGGGCRLSVIGCRNRIRL